MSTRCSDACDRVSAIASKAAGFLVLIQLVRGPFDLNDLLAPVLSYIAAIAILLNNVAAVAQRNVKHDGVV